MEFLAIMENEIPLKYTHIYYINSTESLLIAIPEAELRLREPTFEVTHVAD